ENDVGIQPQDFIVKPLRHSELLDWLERRLALVWADPTPAASAPVPPVEPPAMPQVWPDAAALVALREVVALGFYRGILNQLDAIEARQPDCAAFVTELRTLARQFQFETMGRILSEGPSAP
ncbi:MAG: hypothetical protein KAX62_04105, partial [Xylophilus sp.]|nr:hypothetical protein [Xylophilus sp.]